ncbi:MAG: enoyl-CoA hydratase-related protein [Marinifilaceae bacterium]|jgi:enoyl-CoA hydratase|nr:enoyl-CoA hydratase-related protein [Marinifilaceae bacterium]
MEFNNIIFEQENQIGYLKINRPKALNALNPEVFNDIEKCIQSIEKNADIRVLIITGEGKAFVAGADIKDFPNYDVNQAYDFAERGKEVFRLIENLEIPVIGAINGFALGGGLELALACDIRIASENTMLGLPEVNLGLIPGFDGTTRLTRLIGKSNAKYITMLGEGINAQYAYELGILQKVVALEELMTEVNKIAGKIIKRSPKSISIAKEVINKSAEMNLADASELESKEFGKLFGADQIEKQEGVAAFLEKRKPNWNK